MPRPLQAFVLLSVPAGLLALPLLSWLLTRTGMCDGSWDDKQHVLRTDGPLGAWQKLSRAALGVDEAAATWAAGITAAAYGSLLALDLCTDLRWPASWNTHNTRCYDEMFCEPMRRALVRRPGNTFSNALYLHGAVLVGCSAGRASAFVLADAMFAAMLLLLAVFSTLWHASHAPKVRARAQSAQSPRAAGLMMMMTAGHPWPMMARGGS